MRGHQERCSVCRGSTKHAIVGNRLLWLADVYRLPREGMPSLEWRCEGHQRYKLRQSSAVRATELGDLVFTLTCGHQVHGVFRGRLAYTPALVERGVATRQLRLDQDQRCYLCADEERESGDQPKPDTAHKHSST
jgi:hypothetical protein